MSLSSDEQQTGVHGVGFLMLLLPAGLVWLIFLLWPDATVQIAADGARQVHWKPRPLLGYPISNDVRVLTLVLVAGSLGSFTHAAQSFASYVGNSTFRRTWVWWYVLRLPLGGVIALIIYFLIRGGVLALGAGMPENGALASPDLYKLLGFAGLSGMFSKNATDKLMEVFEALFSSRQDQARGDKLEQGAPRIVSTDPESVEPNQAAVKVRLTVENAEEGARVFVEDRQVPSVDLSEGTIEATLATGAAGDLRLTVQNPGGDKQRSEPFRLPVRPKAAGGAGGNP